MWHSIKRQNSFSSLCPLPPLSKHFWSSEKDPLHLGSTSIVQTSHVQTKPDLFSLTACAQPWLRPEKQKLVLVGIVSPRAGHQHVTRGRPVAELLQPLAQLFPVELLVLSEIAGCRWDVNEINQKAI